MTQFHGGDGQVIMGTSLRVGGIVLCGGESRRMGTPKAWLAFGSEHLLSRVARIVGKVVSPVVLAGREQTNLPEVAQAHRTAFDQSNHAGPLAGMAAGMALLRGECDAALVVGCDHPLMASPVLLRIIELLGDEDAAMPEMDGRLYPTLAVYRLSTLPALEEMLRRGERRAQVFARQCKPRRITIDELTEVDPELRTLINVNEPAEYEAALRLGGVGFSRGIPCEP